MTSFAPLYSPRAGINGSAGFTLLELLVVLTIFALSLAIVGPSVSSGLTGLKMKTSARTLAASLNHARSRAQGSGMTYYAEISEGKVALSSRGEKGVFKEVAMPEEVRLKADGAQVVAFYPAGGSSGGAVEIMDNGNKVFFRLTVEPTTAMVKIEAL